MDPLPEAGGQGVAGCTPLAGTSDDQISSALVMKRQPETLAEDEGHDVVAGAYPKKHFGVSL